ncbi:MAG: hypothetical protein SFX72_21035 [Isosphaeraceae bacterium]|nr:hypothetical protein [Isosphaeraceae bacterium]
MSLKPIRELGAAEAAAAETSIAKTPELPPPAVRGESAHDRVSSLLMAIVSGTALCYGWLYAIYSADAALKSAVITAPLEIIEVEGGGGGSPDGEIGGKETIEVAGGAPADRASNNEDDEASDFEEPMVEATPAALLDSVAEAGESLAEVDIGAVVPNGGRIAGGRRASRIGNGKIGFGPGGQGDGGFGRGERWAIVYDQGQTADEYAKQLDALGVELGVISGNQMIYVSKFTQATPLKRVGLGGGGDKRLYFIWRGQGRKAQDLTLLRKAGIDVGDAIIFQFYPKEVQDRLAQVEVRYKGRQPAEIRRTQFRVVPNGNTYDFAVVSQEPLVVGRG